MFIKSLLILISIFFLNSNFVLSFEIKEIEPGFFVHFGKQEDNTKQNKGDIANIGFIVGVDKVYLTTSNGRLLIIDILNGKTSSILKIDNKKISRPFVLNQNLFIVEKSSIIKLD